MLKYGLRQIKLKDMLITVNLSDNELTSGDKSRLESWIRTVCKSNGLKLFSISNDRKERVRSIFYV